MMGVDEERVGLPWMVKVVNGSRYQRRSDIHVIINLLKSRKFKNLLKGEGLQLKSQNGIHTVRKLYRETSVCQKSNWYIVSAFHTVEISNGSSMNAVPERWCSQTALRLQRLWPVCLLTPKWRFLRMKNVQNVKILRYYRNEIRPKF